MDSHTVRLPSYVHPTVGDGTIMYRALDNKGTPSRGLYTLGKVVTK